MKPVPVNTACTRGVNPAAANSAVVVTCLWHGVGWCSFSSHPPRPTELLGGELPLSITAHEVSGAGGTSHISMSREGAPGPRYPALPPSLPVYSLTAFISSQFLFSQLLGIQSKVGAARQGSEGICLPARAGGHPARTAPASLKSAPDCRCKVMHPLFSCFQIVFSYFQYLCFPRLPSLTVL